VGIDGVRDKLFRREIYPEYKGNRQDRPPEVVEGLLKMKEFFDINNITYIAHEPSEADDVIASIATMFSDNKIKTICVGVDKDLLQIHSKYIRLAKPKKEGITIMKTWNDVKRAFKGVNISSPDKLRDYLAIIGDKADNINGIKGCGEKTALMLIEVFGSLKNIYANIDKIESESIKKKLIAGREDGFLSRRLIKLKCDLDVGTIKDYTYNYNVSETFKFLQKYHIEDKLYSKSLEILDLDF
jgi:DNA polymerase-1